MAHRSKWCLIGIPDHQGVLNVGGRLGAAHGPAAFRKAFKKFKGQDGVLESLALSTDLNPVKSSVEDNHARAADLICQAHTEFGLSVVVGGGHDHGYSHLLGVSKALTSGKKAFRLGCINLDAHLDVRKPSPLISSGSPFFLALNSGLLDPGRFIEFGIQRQCNAPALWDYVEEKKVEVIPFEKIRNGKAVASFNRALKKLSTKCDAIVISLDLDSVATAFAPGVSAPVAEGFTPSELFEMMQISAKEKKVVSLGIFELCPEHDIGERTALLAATAAYQFVCNKM